MNVEALLAHYGIAALFVGAALEGETVAMVGGMVAHRGLYPLPAAWAAIFAGTFLADQGFFFAGRTLRDRGWMQRVRRTSGFTRAQAIFERRPVLFVLLFRFFYGLRTASPAMIGASGFPPARFFALNLVAALVWSALFVGLGYGLGVGVQELVGGVVGLKDWLPYLLIPVAIGIGWKLVRARVKPRDAPDA